MSIRRRKNRHKRPQQENRDFNIRSVSTNLDKKESVSETTQPSQPRSDSGLPKRNSRNKPRNRSYFQKDSRTNIQTSSNPNRRGEQRSPNQPLAGKGIYNPSQKNELKRQFVKSELQKYNGPKIRKPFKTNLDRKTLAPYLINSLTNTVCSICGKNITNMSTVIYDEEKETNSHFDCVYDQIRERYQVGESERIVYVGNGAFAVIEDYKADGVYKFRIKNRIQFSPARSIK